MLWKQGVKSECVWGEPGLIPVAGVWSEGSVWQWRGILAGSPRTSRVPVGTDAGEGPPGGQGAGRGGGCRDAGAEPVAGVPGTPGPCGVQWMNLETGKLGRGTFRAGRGSLSWVPLKTLHQEGDAAA